MHQRLFTLIAIAALAAGLAACGSSSKSSTAASASGTAQITISDKFAFNTTPVAAGSTVTVKNESASQHTVTQDTSGFNVTIDAGKTATFKAPATAGSYTFHCNIHNFMKGTLTVT